MSVPVSRFEEIGIILEPEQAGCESSVGSFRPRMAASAWGFSCGLVLAVFGVCRQPFEHALGQDPGKSSISKSWSVCQHGGFEILSVLSLGSPLRLEDGSLMNHVQSSFHTMLCISIYIYTYIYLNYLVARLGHHYLV